MVSTLVKSADELTQSVERVENAAARPGAAELANGHEALSGVDQLVKAQRTHASMRSYVFRSILAHSPAP